MPRKPHEYAGIEGILVYELGWAEVGLVNPKITLATPEFRRKADLGG
jgi:hypothetical protein